MYNDDDNRPLSPDMGPDGDAYNGGAAQDMYPDDDNNNNDRGLAYDDPSADNQRNSSSQDYRPEVCCLHPSTPISS